MVRTSFYLYGLLLIFLLIFLYGLIHQVKYTAKVNMILDMFESEYECKVRISTETKEFIVNWNP